MVQLKITMIPETGAKSINKATIEVRDAQGIMMEDQVLQGPPQHDQEGVQKAQQGQSPPPKEGQQQDQLETQVHVPENGTVEIRNVGHPMQVDGDQRAGVPDSPEEIDKRMKDEQRRKAENDPYVRRKEAYMQGVPPLPTDQTQTQKFPPSTAHAASGSAEAKGHEADLSKTISGATKDKDESHPHKTEDKKK